MKKALSEAQEVGLELTRKMEEIIFEKQIEEFEAFGTELKQDVNDIKEILLEECPNEMSGSAVE